MNEKQREKIKDMIKDGKWNFVTKYGVGFGAFMFFFFIVWQKFIMEEEIDSFTILFNLILWAIAGLIFGLWMWNIFNKKVKEK